MAPRTGTVDNLADYLVSGYWIASGGGPHQFDTSSSNVVTVNVSGLDAAGKAAARAAFAAWESVADLDFREVTSGGRIGFDDSQDRATTDVAYDPRSGDVISATVTIGSAWLGRYGSAVGTYGYQTYLHEIGHALGLGHPGTYGGGATYANATWTIESWQLSVMSYLDQDENPNVRASKAYVASPMMADIIAIQRMYGAAQGSVTQGDTVWGEGTALGGPLGSVLGGGPGSLLANTLTVFDEGGVDTFRFAATAAAQTINLNAGAFSSLYGKVDNLAIARGTQIERAVGGRGDDRIIGNGANNSLSGNLGDDSIRGGAGRDTLYGGDGDDTLGGDAGGDALWGQAGDDRLSGRDDRDTLAGGDGNDALFGDDGNDLLMGGNGRDRLDGGQGDDVLRGQGGADLIVFREGRDRVAGFEDDVDTIFFDPALWGGGPRTAAQLLAQAGLSNGAVVFAFGNGNSLTIANPPSLPDLLDDIAIL